MGCVEEEEEEIGGVIAVAEEEDEDNELQVARSMMYVLVSVDVIAGGNVVILTLYPSTSIKAECGSSIVVLRVIVTGFVMLFGKEHVAEIAFSVEHVITWPFASCAVNTLFHLPLTYVLLSKPTVV